MIEYIKGELTELTPALATIEATGVGYGLSISLNTFSAIQGKKEVKLYVYPRGCPCAVWLCEQKGTRDV